MSVALRRTVGVRRWVVLTVSVLVAAPALGLLARVVEADRDQAFAAVATLALFALVVPLTCLVVGDNVLGAEVRDGTFALTWLSPVSFAQIVLGRWLAGSLVAAGLLASATAITAVVAGSPSNATAVAVSSAGAAVAYVAVFVLVGAATRRAVMWSLALIYLVEQLGGAALSGVAQYSPQWLGRAALGDLGTGTEELLRDGVPAGGWALVRLALVAAVALVAATVAVSRARVSGGHE